MSGTPESQMSEDAQNVSPTIGIDLKKCTKCGNFLPVYEFCKCKRDGIQSWCKQCKHNHYLDNKERVLIRSRKYYELNKASISEKSKIYRLNNEDKIRDNKKARWPGHYLKHASQISEYQKRYRDGKKDILRERVKKSISKKPDFYRKITKYHNDKKRSNPKYRLHYSVSRAIRRSIKNKNCRSWESLVGYTIEQLCAHLEKQFQPGMTWENYGQWHIDHIMPIAALPYVLCEDYNFKIAWDLKNLQPLWAEDNYRKGSKICLKE